MQYDILSVEMIVLKSYYSFENAIYFLTYGWVFEILFSKTVALRFVPDE